MTWSPVPRALKGSLNNVPNLAGKKQKLIECLTLGCCLCSYDK